MRARRDNVDPNHRGAESRPIPFSVVDWTDCLVLLQQGDVEAIFTTDSILIGLLAQDPATEMVGERFTLEPHGLAIALENPDFVHCASRGCHGRVGFDCDP